MTYTNRGWYWFARISRHTRARCDLKSSDRARTDTVNPSYWGTTWHGPLLRAAAQCWWDCRSCWRVPYTAHRKNEDFAHWGRTFRVGQQQDRNDWCLFRRSTSTISAPSTPRSAGRSLRRTTDRTPVTRPYYSSTTAMPAFGTTSALGSRDHLSDDAGTPEDLGPDELAALLDIDGGMVMVVDTDWNGLNYYGFAPVEAGD